MLKIRLCRMGASNAPFYRVVVSDSRRTPTASSLEELGYYDPRVSPPTIRIDQERVSHWVGKGAQLSPTVGRLLPRAQPIEKGVARQSGAQPGATGEANAAADAEAPAEA
jgi:small subunit ribosomal protein S16